MSYETFDQYFKAVGLSLSRAARKFNTCPKTISRWKNGEPMRRENARFVSQVTGIPEAVLVGVNETTGNRYSD